MCEYHYLYLKNDTLLWVDVFVNFRKICLDIYKLDPVNALSSPGLAWQAALIKAKVELPLLTDINIDMLLMVEKRIIASICYSINRYTKANNKLWKIENMESS